MKFSASVQADEHGEYVAECESVGVSARGLSPANALDALREEIRYRVELCPCSTVGDDWVELVVEE